MENIILNVQNLNKYYVHKGYNLQILNRVSFSAYENEFLGLLGPLGSGKSVLMKILAGIEEGSDSGSIIDFKKKKNLAYIPSNPSSLPWLNVKENLEYALEVSGKSINEDFTIEIINSVGLAGYEDHSPDNMSIGFRFRIALGRALVTRPAVLLIDEPFNNLDETTKKELLFLLREIRNDFKLSIIYSTSNISEAIFLSDRILMIGESPATIISALNIDLPAQSNLDTFASQLFFDLLKQIELEFRSDSTKVLSSFLL